MLGSNYLWGDATFIVCAPFNPHLSYSEGPIVVVKTKSVISSAWQDPILAGKAFELAVKVAQVMDDLRLAPWFNLQANSNWGLLPDTKQFFHIYIYGRNRTQHWAKPIILPESPKTYNNDPMPEIDRNELGLVLKSSLVI